MKATRQGSEVEGTAVRPIDLDAGRRAFIRSVGLSAAAAAIFAGGAVIPGEAEAQSVTDADILNFALNLEYLEAEFYLRAVFGRGLRAGDVGTSPGRVDGGRKVNFSGQRKIREYAEEIAIDEENHVQFLRKALGSAAVKRPRLNIGTAFRDAAQAAGLGPNFDAYASVDNFLLAAFIFEDVGVTGYKGAAPLISNKDTLEAAAGILAAEAYHAGIIRTVLFSRDVIQPTVNISNLRDKADGTGDKDQPIIGRTGEVEAQSVGKANLVPLDSNGLAFSRTTGQVLGIVYLGNNRQGGFFPNGMNGRFR
jgi:hypothetical protein